MGTSTFPPYWSARAHEQWRHLRARGVARFVFVRGVIAWGGSMFTLAALSLLVAKAFSANLPSDAILQVAIVCFGGGLAWGILVWCICEVLYRKHAAVAR